MKSKLKLQIINISVLENAIYKLFYTFDLTITEINKKICTVILEIIIINQTCSNSFVAYFFIIL
jgi:hypothetical protein